MSEIQKQPAARQLSRRAVTAGTAWAVPAVAWAAAAPAFASSTCQPADYTFGTTLDGVNVTTTATKVGTFNTPTTNLTTTTIQGTSALILQQKPQVANSQYQEVTFTFSQPVYNLSFTVFDIDGTQVPQMGGYLDQVSVTKVNGGTASGFTSVKGSNVTGSGTAASPWTAVNKTTPTDPGKTTVSDVNVSFAPSTGISSFTLRYSTATLGVTQEIYIGNLSFTSTNC